MEREIGEIFEINGVKYKCLEDDSEDCNRKCCFHIDGCDFGTSDLIGVCGSTRKDKKSVYFLRIDSV